MLLVFLVCPSVSIASIPPDSDSDPNTESLQVAAQDEQPAKTLVDVESSRKPRKHRGMPSLRNEQAHQEQHC